jgi:flagellar motor switch protein FliM
LILVLDGPDGTLGLMVLSNAVLSAMIDMQTMGAIHAVAGGDMRRPTRTDAAIVTACMDRVLGEMDQLLADEADLVWAGGYRFASFLEEPRPLGLLLDDTSYRRIDATVRLGGKREGNVILALQAREGAGLSLAHHEAEDGKRRAHFSQSLAALVQDTEVRMEAVVGRIILTIADIMDLRVGQALQMPQAGVDRISLETSEGRLIATGKLGQNRGLRALRLTELAPGAATENHLAAQTPRSGATGVALATGDNAPLLRTG